MEERKTVSKGGEGMTRKLLLVALMSAIAASSAFSAELQWFGGAHDRDWFNQANWGASGGPIPTGVDKVKLNYVWANPGPIISAPGAVANEIFISEDRDLGTIGRQDLTVAEGGELTANGQVLLGYYGADSRAGFPANEGGLIMTGGVANLVGHLFVGFTGIGHLEVHGGTLNVGGMFGLGWNGGSGHVIIDGGVLHTEQWNFSPSALTTYTFEVNGGKWIQNHYWVNEIQALVDAGKITTSIPGAQVQVSWDPVLEQTIVTVPEPITVGLLGLGALGLLRKKN
jgi:hypothetical protein